MFLVIVFLAFSSFLALGRTQFPQYPQPFSDSQISPPFNNFYPYRGGYQLRTSMPPRFNPFDNVYNKEGEKLTCKMICGPDDIEQVEGIDKPKSPPEKKENDENKM